MNTDTNRPWGKPITPAEACEALNNRVPEFIIEAVNRLLKAKIRVNQVTITILQSDVINEAIKIYKERASLWDAELTKSMIFDKGWLDIEPIFEKAGWQVEYDKPAYNETFRAASFKFTATGLQPPPRKL
jgi:hypothetical protein